MLKLLITGGCGFIGSNFILKQFNSGSCKNAVLNIDKLTYAGNIENLSSIANEPNYMFKNVDINDLKLVTQTIDRFEPDTIVHFAAESHVDRSIDGPMKFIQTNIVGTANLLCASLKYWKKLKINDKLT